MYVCKKKETKNQKKKVKLKNLFASMESTMGFRKRGELFLQHVYRFNPSTNELANASKAKILRADSDICCSYMGFNYQSTKYHLSFHASVCLRHSYV